MAEENRTAPASMKTHTLPNDLAHAVNYTSNERRAVPPLIPHGQSIAPMPECTEGFPKFDSLQQYGQAIFSDSRLYHTKASLYKIHALAALTSATQKDVYISIRAAERTGLALRTMVRCDEECPTMSESQGPSRFQTLFYMYIPKDRGFNNDDIQRTLRQGRGPASKIVLAVQFATENNLTYRLNRILYDSKSPFYMEECISGLRNCTTFESDMLRVRNDTVLLEQIMEAMRAPEEQDV